MSGRTFSPDFKLRVARQMARGEKTQAEICRDHTLASSIVWRWKHDYERYGEQAFLPKRTMQERLAWAKVEEMARHRLGQVLAADEETLPVASRGFYGKTLEDSWLRDPYRRAQAAGNAFSMAVIKGVFEKKTSLNALYELIRTCENQGIGYDSFHSLLYGHSHPLHIQTVYTIAKELGLDPLELAALYVGRPLDEVRDRVLFEFNWHALESLSPEIQRLAAEFVLMLREKESREQQAAAV